MIEYKGISSRAFALKISVSSQSFGKYLQGREPSASVLGDIIETFDDISPDWLLTGNGDMLRSATHSESSKEDRLISIIESQQRTIDMLVSQANVQKDE